jgi:methylated-DNA-[protein]-cysteine S-methyltransferase
MKFNISTLNSPLGVLLIVSDDRHQLRALDFSNSEAHLHRRLREHYTRYELTEASAPIGVTDALQRYFDGQILALDEIPTETAGTEFQRQVWAALRRIPAGETTSYGELARSIGYDDPRVAIDIGSANGSNPIAIVVPCHRVITKSGGLGGYAWGIDRKRWLLTHEGALPLASQDLRLPGF